MIKELFCIYMYFSLGLIDTVRQYRMGFHFYADDTQLYLSFNSLDGDDQVSSVAQVGSCVRDTDHWMVHNKIRLNRDKIELIVIGSKHWPCPPLDSILVGDCCVCPSYRPRVQV